MLVSGKWSTRRLPRLYLHFSQGDSFTILQRRMFPSVSRLSVFHCSLLQHYLMFNVFVVAAGSAFCSAVSRLLPTFLCRFRLCTPCFHFPFLFFFSRFKKKMLRLSQTATKRLAPISISHQSPCSHPWGTELLLMHKYLTIQWTHCEQRGMQNYGCVLLILHSLFVPPLRGFSQRIIAVRKIHVLSCFVLSQ